MWIEASHQDTWIGNPEMVNQVMVKNPDRAFQALLCDGGADFGKGQVPGDQCYPHAAAD